MNNNIRWKIMLSILSSSCLYSMVLQSKVCRKDILYLKVGLDLSRGCCSESRCQHHLWWGRFIKLGDGAWWVADDGWLSGWLWVKICARWGRGVCLWQMGLCVSKSSQMDSGCTMCLQDIFFADDKSCRLLDLNTLPVTIIVTKEKIFILCSELSIEKSHRGQTHVNITKRANRTPAAKPVVVFKSSWRS